MNSELTSCWRCCRDLLWLSTVIFTWLEWREPRKYQSRQPISEPKFGPEFSRPPSRWATPSTLLSIVHHVGFNVFQDIKWQMQRRVTHFQARCQFTLLLYIRKNGLRKWGTLFTSHNGAMRAAQSTPFSVIHNSVISNVTGVIMKVGTALNDENNFNVIEGHKAVVLR